MICLKRWLNLSTMVLGLDGYLKLSFTQRYTIDSLSTLHFFDLIAGFVCLFGFYKSSYQIQTAYGNIVPYILFKRIHFLFLVSYNHK